MFLLGTSSILVSYFAKNNNMLCQYSIKYATDLYFLQCADFDVVQSILQASKQLRGDSLNVGTRLVSVSVELSALVGN